MTHGVDTAENNHTPDDEPRRSQTKPSRAWTACVKKARPLFSPRTSGHQKKQIWDSENCVQLYVNEPNYLQKLCLVYPFVCKIGEQPGCGPALLHEVCKERGWKEFQSNPGESKNGNSWNLWWQYGKTVKSASRFLHSWQMTNFTNQKYNFTEKDVCSRFLARLQKSYGSGFDFGPMSFNLPSDYPRLCSEHSKRSKRSHPACASARSSAGSLRRVNCRDRQRSSDDPIWICKPVGKSRGRGITVFDTVTKIGYHTQSVVQEYISRPYLIGGYKWDLRIYVSIVSTNPLIIYAYREGLVRFATNQFTLKNLYNHYAHLTNTSLNKGSPTYRQPKEVIGVGCKWTLQKLRRHWLENNVQDWYLWQRILKILILTIIGDADNIVSMLNSSKTFSLFGFDIMVNSVMKPYLLEVNKNPGLGHDCEVDTIVKKPMLHDLFDLLGLPNNARHFESHPTRGLNCSPNDLTLLNYAVQNPSDVLGGEINGHNLRLVIKNHNSGQHSARKLSHEEIPLSNLQSCSDNKVSPKNRYFSVTGLPGNQRICLPALDKIPADQITDKQETKHNNEITTPGLVLDVRNWRQSSPSVVGDWVRIFPFDSTTGNLSRKSAEFDIRLAINRTNDYIKAAKLVFKTQSTNTNSDECDTILRETLGLNVPVWHPYNSGSSYDIKHNHNINYN